MIDTLKKLFWISRPISWINTAFTFAATYLVMTGRVDTLFIIGTLFFLIPYNLLMYGINDVFDYESDIRNPRKGGIEGMREQRAFHPTIIKAVWVTTVPFVIYLLIFSGPAAALVLAGLLFFVVAYSIAKLRFKERPLLDSITSSIHFVGPMIYALVLTSFSPEAIPYVIAFFLWGMASHALGAVQDIIPDRQGKLASIATFLGARWTVRFAALLYAGAVVLLLFQAVPYSILAIPGLLYIANIYPYLNVTDTDSGTVNKAWRRFIYLNLIAGFSVTVLLLLQFLV